MANPQHLEILNHGVEAWNRWRVDNPTIQPDFSRANLDKIDLERAILNWSDFRKASLNEANFTDAECRHVNFNGAQLSRSKFVRAELKGAWFNGADLSAADFTGAQLIGVKFHGSELHHVDFTNATLGWVSLADIDLSQIKGLDELTHVAPSTVGVDTLYKSGGKIPIPFLRGCGVPDDFLTFLPSIISAQQAIEFYSCFISYSHKDEEVASRLYNRMRKEHLRVWFAPEDIRGGEKLHEQIDRAIQTHDRLLIVLSVNSMQSEWVISEIRKARQAELKEGRRKLFPIRLVDFRTLQNWNCFDADSGKDLAVEVREYFIPDFSNWKDSTAFERSFSRLLNDLKAAETPTT